MLEVRWDKMTEGHLNQLEERLRRALGQFIRRYGNIYVGVSIQPEERAKQHDKRGLSEERGWSALIVIWRTTSRKNAKRAENMLISWAEEHAINVNRSGGGLAYGAPEYFVYVVV